MNKVAALTILVAGLTSASLAFAAKKANPVKGAELFKQCAGCHAVGEGAENGIGPQLNHVFGRPAASMEDFSYSEALQAKASDESVIWHEETLYIFIASPQYFAKGTTMGFPGFRKEQDVRDLMSHLIQFSPAYESESLQETTAEAIAESTLPEIKVEEEETAPEFSAEYMSLATAIESGGELWAKQCRHCHGNSAYPGKAPKLKPAGYTPDFVYDRLTNGFRKMPAWKTVFSQDQRKSIVAYIMSDDFSP